MAEAGISPAIGGAVVLAVLAAALMHACWNALIRAAPDKALFTVLMHTCSALIAGVGLLFTGWPDASSAPYAAASVLLHWIYIAMLARTYDGGQLAVSYVLMRGLAPLIVCCVAVLALHESLSFTAWSGTAVVLAGVLIVAHAGDRPLAHLLRHRSGRAALLNAAVIAGYTLIDGQGVRASGNPLAYALTLALFEPTAALFMQWRRRPRSLLAYARGHWAMGVLGGLIATTAYAVVLWAMTRAPIPIVATLRESSVVFAVLIGNRCFNEGRLGVGLTAALCVIAGVALLRA